MRIKSWILGGIGLLLLGFPAQSQSLENLLPELRGSYQALSQRNELVQKLVEDQNAQLTEITERCNALSLQLYSIEQDNSFDLSSILSQVTEQYRRFNQDRIPFAEIEKTIQGEQDRYQRLEQTLRHMAPRDSAGTVQRDSCLFYAAALEANCKEELVQLSRDKAYYEKTEQLLRSANDYAQERYDLLQKKLFVQGGSNYFHTLKSFGRYWNKALIDVRKSSRRGVSVYLSALALLLLLCGVIVFSLQIRIGWKQGWQAFTHAYLPTVILSFLVIFLRVIYVPTSLIAVLFPALVLGFFIWQASANSRKGKALPREDSILLWVSACVMAVGVVLSWTGLVMSSLLLLVWWLFQLAVLELVMDVRVVVGRYYGGYLQQKQIVYRRENARIPLGKENGACIEVTWLKDFLNLSVYPLCYIWSVPIAVFLSCRVFDFLQVAEKIFFGPLIQVEGFLHLTLFKLMLVVSLFFVFRYLSYALKSFYHIWRTRAVIDKLAPGVTLKETDINFNLANNILTLLVWLVYIIAVFLLLKIPTSALTLISTGLVTGLGFAMKDVLNNFFYGVQLMGGRVRVGDMIECDGIRGTVCALSYQSTQVEATDSSIIVFTNSALFNKNFKNLTRNHSYELMEFKVGVKYGTDVEKARAVVLQAIEPLIQKDKYGREVVDKKKGVSVRLFSFDDSAINLQVLLYTTVETHFTFAAQAKEAIYNAFAANGIEIPFPQQDVYIKEMPGKGV